MTMHLVNRVTQLAQLIHSSPSLDKGVISSSDCTHAGWFIACVALSAILKVRVWSARAIHTDVACGGDVRAAVRLGHDGHHCNTRCCSYRLCTQPARFRAGQV